jgi:hypothetical protein
MTSLIPAFQKSYGSPHRALHVLVLGWDSQFLLQRSGHTTGLAIMVDNNSVYFSKVAGLGGVETKTALMLFKQATGNLGIGNTPVFDTGTPISD